MEAAARGRYVLAEISSLDAVQQPVKSSTRIKYTCVSVSGRHVAVGTSTGSVHVFDRAQLTYKQGVVVEQESGRSAVSHVTLCPADDNLIATAFSSGVIVVSLLEGAGRDRTEKVLRNVTLLKDSSITTLTWEADGSRVMAGAENGFVCAVNVVNTRKEFFLPPAEIIMRLDSAIVQIDACAHSAVVSTATRTYLCYTQKQQFKQIGKKIRDTRQGACFFQSGGLAEPVLYCARPGSRLWEVNGAGQVVSTHQFKRLLDVPPIPYVSVLEAHQELSLPTENPGPQSIAFTTLHSLNDQYLVTLCDKGLFVFNPAQIQLLFWTHTLSAKDVVDMAVYKKDIYLLFHGNQLRKFSLISIPKLVTHLYSEGMLHQCARVMSAFKDSLLSYGTKLNTFGVNLDMLEALKAATKQQDPDSKETADLVAVLQKLIDVVAGSVEDNREGEDKNDDNKKKTMEFKRSESDIFVGKPRSCSTESNNSVLDDTALVQRVQEFQAIESPSVIAMETPIATTTTTKDPDTISRTSTESLESPDKIKHLKSTAIEQLDKAQNKLSGLKSRLLQRVTSIGSKEEAAPALSLSSIRETTEGAATQANVGVHPEIVEGSVSIQHESADTANIEHIPSTNGGNGNNLDDHIHGEYEKNKNKYQTKSVNEGTGRRVLTEDSDSSFLDSTGTFGIKQSNVEPDISSPSSIPQVVIEPSTNEVTSGSTVTGQPHVEEGECTTYENKAVGEGRSTETVATGSEGATLGQPSPDTLSLSSGEITFTAPTDQPEQVSKSGRATPTQKSKKKKAKVISFDGESPHKPDSTKKLKKSKSDSNVQSKSLLSIFSTPGKELPESQSNPSLEECIEESDQSKAATQIAEMEITEEEGQGGLARRLSKASLNVVKDKLQTKAKSLVQTIKDTKEKISTKPDFLQQPLDVASGLSPSTVVGEENAHAKVSAKPKPEIDLNPLVDATQEAMQALQETENECEVKVTLNKWARVLNSMMLKTVSRDEEIKSCSVCYKSSASAKVDRGDFNDANQHGGINETATSSEKVIQPDVVHNESGDTCSIKSDIATNKDCSIDSRDIERAASPNIVGVHQQSTDIASDANDTEHTHDVTFQSTVEKPTLDIEAEVKCSCAESTGSEMNSGTSSLLTVPVISDPFAMSIDMLNDVKRLATTCVQQDCYGDITNILKPHISLESKRLNLSVYEPDVTRINALTPIVSLKTSGVNQPIPESNEECDGNAFDSPIPSSTKALHSSISESVEERNTVRAESVEDRNMGRAESVEDRNTVRAESVEDRNTVRAESVEDRNTVRAESVEDRNTVRAESVEDRNMGRAAESVQERNTVRAESVEHDEKGLFMRCHWYALDVEAVHAHVLAVEDTEERYRLWRVLIQCLEALAGEERAFCEQLAAENIQAALHTLRTATLTDRHSYLGCISRLFKLVPKWTLHLCSSPELQVAVSALDVLYLCRAGPSFRQHLVDYVTLCARHRGAVTGARTHYLDELLGDGEVYKHVLEALIQRGQPAASLACACRQLPLPHAHRVMWDNGDLIEDILKQDSHLEYDSYLLDLCRKYSYWTGYIRILKRNATDRHTCLATVVMQLYDVTLFGINSESDPGYWPNSKRDWDYLLYLKDKLHNQNITTYPINDQCQVDVAPEKSVKMSLDSPDEVSGDGTGMTESWVGTPVERKAPLNSAAPSASAQSDKWCLSCRRALPTLTPSATTGMTKIINSGVEITHPYISGESAGIHCKDGVSADRAITWDKMALLLLQAVGGRAATEMLKAVTDRQFWLPFSFYQRCVLDALHQRRHRERLDGFVAKIDQHYQSAGMDTKKTH